MYRRQITVLDKFIKNTQTTDKFLWQLLASTDDTEDHWVVLHNS